MTIILQHTETRDFVHRDAGWTQDRTLARRFQSGHEAVIFCAARGLAHVQVAYEFPDHRMNFAKEIFDDETRPQRPAVMNGPTTLTAVKLNRQGSWRKS
jgi:hypothetical protein